MVAGGRKRREKAEGQKGRRAAAAFFSTSRLLDF
jgi:hypothetical protein